MKKSTLRKFNNWKDYKGKYKGKLLTPMQYMQYGTDKHLVMSNRTYYKEFCRFDHMKRDKLFVSFLREFRTKDTKNKKTYWQDIVFNDLYVKLKYITLNDFYDIKKNPNTCMKNGNFLTEWEIKNVHKICSRYAYWIKNKDEIIQERKEQKMYDEEMEEELEYLERQEEEIEYYRIY